MIFDAHSDALFGIIHYPEKNLLESWPKEYYGILNYYFKGTESYDSFLFILEKISQLKNEEFFKTWITKILKNECYDIIRKNKKITYIGKMIDIK